jgi:hypothetical protein
MDYTRIIDISADTINVASVAYTRQADGAFYMAPEHADSLLSDGKCGAYRAPLDYASPTSSPMPLIESLIRGAAPCEKKTALLVALTSLTLKALRQ